MDKLVKYLLVGFGAGGVVPYTVAAETAVAEELPEEIQVTARRRTENLIDVPIAVSTLGSEALEALGAQNLNDLTAIIPNLTIQSSSAQTNGASIFLRGIGQRDSLQTFEQGVGLYVDGVYYSRMQASLARMFDVERVEVLRGPQGTLYGKNTIGGAVNVITRSPFAEAGGRIEVSYGNYDLMQARGTGNALLSETVGLSVSAQYTKRDGYFEDTSTGRDFNDDNVFIGRMKLGVKASDQLELTFAADIMDIDVAAAAGRAEADVFLTDTINGQLLARPAPTGEFDGSVSISIVEGEGQSNTHYGFSLTADWEINERLSLKSVSAYRHMNPVNWLDADGTGLALADVIATWEHEQLSQELHLAVTEERWDLLLGAFFMTEESVAVQETFLPDFLVADGQSLGFSRPGNDEQDVKNIALFAHGDVRLTDKLSLSVGARWSRDDKTFFRVSETAFGGVVTDAFIFNGSDDWSAFTPSAAISYKPSATQNLYARVARGFRSGGFNGRLFSAADAVPFAPEFVWSYEAGWKGVSDNRRVRYGLSAFYNDYTDFQVRTAVAVDSSDPSAGFNFPTINAAALEIYGAEAEISIDLGALNLWGNIGLLNSSYKEFLDDSRDRTGEEPIRSPDVTLNGGMSYSWGLSGGSQLQLAADARYVSSYYTSVDNSDLLYEDGYALVNATLKWEAADGGWYAKLTGRNIFDAVYHVDAFEFRTLGNIQTAFYGDPRTWIFSLGKEF